MTDATPHSAASTREVLLDTAERLFAERGIGGASLRAITGAAGTNLAAVNYHFGSKEGLVRALFTRRLGPLNQQRLERLAECEAEDGPPAVECVLRAFVEPVVRMLRDAEHGRAFARLVGRSFHDPEGDTQTLLLEEFRETSERFAEALATARPELSLQEVLWRLHYTIGAMAHTTAMGHLAERQTDGLCDPSDVETNIRHITQFLVAGWQAPPSPAAGEVPEDAP